MNNISIIGRTTKDIELRYTTTGIAVATFSIAVNDGFGDKKKVYFFDVQAWKKIAENISKFVSKGDKIGVFGSLQQQRWEKDGKKYSKVIINAFGVEFFLENALKAESSIESSSQPEEKPLLSEDVKWDEEEK